MTPVGPVWLLAAAYWLLVAARAMIVQSGLTACLFARSRPWCPDLLLLDLLLLDLLLVDLLLGVVGLGELISHELLVKPTNGRTVVLNGPS
jgi:hypothetical protein